MGSCYSQPAEPKAPQVPVRLSQDTRGPQTRVARKTNTLNLDTDYHCNLVRPGNTVR